MAEASTKQSRMDGKHNGETGRRESARGLLAVVTAIRPRFTHDGLDEDLVLGRHCFGNVEWESFSEDDGEDLES